jgi:predicted DNA-binding transcriptional regulator AlpA
MNEILTATEVADYFRISVSTLKRWLMQTRRGTFDLPMPITAKSGLLRWRKEDIETWSSQIGNEIKPPTEQPRKFIAPLLKKGT